MAAPLLQTKLNIPSLRENMLRRTHLLRQLDSLLEPGRRLGLIAAPAGFGKTTLIITWLKQIAGWNTGWLSLDREHNDPARFLGYLCEIITRQHPQYAAEIRALVESGAGGDYVLAQLINILAEAERGMLIVLDDYHEISDARIHQALAYLVDQLPDRARLLITSRIDPPLPLGRMRARGQLVELRADQLRFTPAETAAFLSEIMALDISETLAAALEDRTEGWAAGLQLAALSMRDITDPAEREQFVQAFTGSHRHVVDYLAEEVLARQSADVLDFLLRTAVLDRFCAELCDAVTERHDSRALLDHLDRANLFLIPLDGDHRWYRYHHLFADLLRLRLRHDLPDAAAGLHQRAAHWFESQGLAREAIYHALTGGDFEHAADLIEASSEATLSRGEIETLDRWMTALPQAVILARPRLCVERARLLLIQQRMSGVETLLNAAEIGLRAQPSPDLLLLGSVVGMRAYPAHERHDYQASVNFSQEALTFFPDAHVAERGATVLYLAHSLHFGGWTRESVPHFLDAITLLQRARNTFNTMMAMGQLATVYELLGNLHQARAILTDAFDWARANGVEQLTPTAVPHVRLGNILRALNALDEAEDHLRAALALTRGGRPLVNVRASVFLARVLEAKGDPAGADAAMANAQALVRDWETGIERSFVEFNQALLHLRRGEMARLASWLQQEKLGFPDVTQPLPNYHEQKLLVWARALIALGGDALTDALELLDRLAALAETAGRIGILIEVRVLQALAHNALGSRKWALAALSDALRHAAPQGHVRVFLDEGTPLLELLAALPRDHAQAAYARHLLDKTGAHAVTLVSSGKSLYQTADGFLLETLSERELQVLHLLSQGLSSNDVADHLIIAVETARKHIKNIYGKLDVHNKVEAVRRAQELRLI